MAAGRHNLSRRAVLGAVAGACASHPLAALGIVAVTVPNPGRWTRALAAFRRAEARLSAFQVKVGRLPSSVWTFPASEALNDRFDALECGRLAALRRLLRAPAPDLLTLSLKLDLAVADQVWELTDSQPCLAALQADARRLASES
jgi:hypothetical protein